MYKMPIFLNKVTFKVTRYGIKKGIQVLQKKHTIQSSNEVCIGNNLETINNPIYNEYLRGRLESKYAKTNGCIIEFISVEEINQCGYTTKRFREQAA
tara:strand:- start:5 stop:295 length:291 start_codon:yes stop_codon:yes gene_type:complete